MFQLKREFKEDKDGKWFKFDSKYDERRYFWGNCIAVALILMLIPFIGYTIYFMASEAKDCLDNPLIYGMSKMDDDNAHCMCYYDTQSNVTKIFYVNRTQLWVNQPIRTSRMNYVEINLSKFR